MTTPTFDQILPTLKGILAEFAPQGGWLLPPLLINRDLNGRVRLVVDASVRDDDGQRSKVVALASMIHDSLGNHAYPAAQAILYEADLNSLLKRESTLSFEGYRDVFIADRLAVENDWSTVTPISSGCPRVAFFSIKGGVGRSTALAVTAWALAEEGKRVMVIDLDLESPGLSSSLLSSDRRPKYGVADWLVEDLVDNGDAVIGDMTANSTLSRAGEILVVPAHGANHGEYISKLGRVWMPKIIPGGRRESWSFRLRRMIDRLEADLRPDVVLVDSRAGIDEVGAACLMHIGASTILLFALNGDQTWSGYRMLFQHWHKVHALTTIRERLQVVGAMIPETNAADYYSGLRQSSWELALDELYDEVPANLGEGEAPDELRPLEEPTSLSEPEAWWSFDLEDESAPHYPWAIRWNRGFEALQNIHGRMGDINQAEVQAIFGPLIDGIKFACAFE